MRIGAPIEALPPFPGRVTTAEKLLIAQVLQRRKAGGFHGNILSLPIREMQQ
jgi:hypothetical protein